MSATSNGDHAPPPPTDSTLTSRDGRVHVALTSSPLDIPATLDLVRSPEAGALVMFAGTTRNHFDGRPVADLAYSAYTALALRTLQAVAEAALDAHGLHGAAVVHRLGAVPVGEESVLVVVSAAHRAAAWRAGEAALEAVKARAEIWKLERFVEGGEAWRANCAEGKQA